MKVLLAQPNLLTSIGGGETVYKSLICNNPEVDFYVLVDKIDLRINPADNCHQIKLANPRSIKAAYESGKFKLENEKKNTYWQIPHWKLDALQRAERIGRSVKEYSFDFVDVPEYLIVGDFLRSEFIRQKIDFGSIVHFFHGSLSRTLFFESKDSKKTPDLQLIEEIEETQRDSCDLAVALSEWYPNNLSFESSKIHYINPLQFLKEDIYSHNKELGKPNLVTFGRLERRKGFDLALEISRHVRDKIDSVNIKGPIHENPKLSKEFYSRAVNRSVPIKLEEAKNAKSVYNSLREYDILMIPSRFDSFNLVALEALYAGKIVAISEECGIYNFLKTNYPEVFFIPISAAKLGMSSKAISESLINFAQNKDRLNLNKSILKPTKTNDYYRVLRDFRKDSKENNTQIFRIKYNYLRTFLLFIFGRMQRVRLLTTFLKKSIQSLKLLKNFNLRFFLFSQFGVHANKRNDFLPVVANLFLPLRKISSKRYGHFLTFLDYPSEFYKLTNNPSISRSIKLAYATRIFRYLNFNPQELSLESIQDLTDKLKVIEISKVLAILSTSNPTSSKLYLQKRQLDLKHWKPGVVDVQSRIEINSNSIPRVTIVVSSYNAMSKMSVFFDRLSCVPELLNGLAEIFLVDANSANDELKVAANLCSTYGIQMRGVRTRERITIQEAWNLGVEESKSEFLMFLGVDETIYSDAISQLLAKFESEPELDWVMGNSLISSVSVDGDLLSDVMLYNRADATEIHPYLETCYVSYVGGMYRRNIHAKFGFYDSTFRGAGDTEFKSRVLPFLKVGYIQDTLGEFLNYPDDRTTASPLVELEDLRAWYVFRSVGGLLYQSDILGSEFLHKLLSGTLGYRKSYCSHISIDLTLARDIYLTMENLGILTKEDVEARFLLLKILSLQEKIFFGPIKIFNFKKVISLIRLLMHLRKYLNKPEWSLRETFEQYRHDNIFEQHHWFW